MSETATFTVIGYEEPSPGEIEALLVAERGDKFLDLAFGILAVGVVVALYASGM